MTAPERIGCTLCTGKQPRRATVGLVCGVCRDRLDDRLADIPRKYGPLSQIEWLLPVVGERAEGKRGKADAAPIPIRLDVLNLTGPTNPAESSTEPRIGSLPTLAVVESWERLTREDLGFPAGTRSATVDGCVAFLRAQLDRICGQGWVDEFAYAIRHAHDMLRDVWGEHRPQPVGTCPVPVERDGGTVDCGATLWVATYMNSLRCRSCGTVWDYDQWQWLGKTMGVIAS